MFDDVTDTWLVGIVARDEALSGLRVHGGLVAAGPASGMSQRLQIRLRFGGESADGPGFPDETDARALLDREQELVEVLGDEAVMVAAVTVPGFRDLLFHVEDAERCRERLSSEAPVEVDAFSDPAWSAYRALFADAVTADGDRRRIEDVARATGEGTPVCTVVHTFSFADLAQADQAAAALREAGLTVAFVSSDDVAVPAPPVFTVTETETLTQVEMARSRDVLSGFASSWEGDYQGWIVTDPTIP